MATPIRSSMANNSSKDGTGDAINGSEVDANPNTLANLLDGTDTTAWGQAGQISFEAFRVLQDTVAAGSVQDQWVYEWDPSDGSNLTDGSSGLGMVWKLPDDGDTQTVFGRLNMMLVDDAASSEDGEFVWSVQIAGTSREVLSYGANGAVFNEDSQDLDLRAEGANNDFVLFLDASQDSMSFGGGNVDGAAFTLNNLTTRTATTSVGSQYHVPAQTTNFDNTSGTIAIGSGAFFGIPTWTNANATLTMTNAATVYIQGAPVDSTNVTASTAGYSLWVDAGPVRFDGGGAMTGTWTDLGTVTTIDINGGNIDGTVIGAASAAAGSFAAIVGTSLDINGAADISGDLTLSAGADGALKFANAGENSIKIPDNQASALIIEEADAAYLTFVTTNSGEKITLGKKLEAGSVEIEGSGFDINGGAIDGTIIGAASAAAGTFAALVGTSLSVSDGNITNVGDIALDSISSDAGTSIDVVLGSDAGDDFTVDTTKLVIEGDTGNVGIGLAAPGNQLEIAKSAGEAILELSCWSTTDGHFPLFIFQKSGSATIGTMAVTAADEVLGSMHFHGVNTSSGTSAGARIQIEQDGAAGETFIPGRVGFQCATDTAGMAEVCRVTRTAFRPTSNDAYDLGTSSYRFDDVYATNGTIDTSDLTRKTAIADTDLGLDFIEKLRPVSYKFKNYIEKRVEEGADGNAITVDVEHTYLRRHYGLIAQEIETVLAGKDCAALIKSPKEGGGHNYGLRYTELLAPLIKAVQELSAKVKILEAA
jgi:hypothetical protein